MRQKVLHVVPSLRYGSAARLAALLASELDRQRFESEQSDIRPVRKQFYRRMGPSGFKKEDVEASLEQLGNTCARMDKALEKGPWLLGAEYSLADIIVAPLIDCMADLGFAGIWNPKYPRVGEWYERMQARPAFRQTFYRGARMSEFLPLRPAIAPI